MEVSDTTRVRARIQVQRQWQWQLQGPRAATAAAAVAASRRSDRSMNNAGRYTDRFEGPLEPQRHRGHRAARRFIQPITGVSVDHRVVRS